MKKMGAFNSYNIILLCMFLKINCATQVNSIYNDSVKKKTNQIHDFCTVLRNVQEVQV